VLRNVHADDLILRETSVQDLQKVLNVVEKCNKKTTEGKYAKIKHKCFSEFETESEK
jgi:hypothetical protein